MDKYETNPWNPILKNRETNYKQVYIQNFVKFENLGQTKSLEFFFAEKCSFDLAAQIKQKELQNVLKERCVNATSVF